MPPKILFDNYKARLEEANTKHKNFCDRLSILEDYIDLLVYLGKKQIKDVDKRNVDDLYYEIDESIHNRIKEKFIYGFHAYDPTHVFIIEEIKHIYSGKPVFYCIHLKVLSCIDKCKNTRDERELNNILQELRNINLPI